MIDEVKAHFVRNKVAYSVGAGFVLTGVAFYFGVRVGSNMISVSPVFNNSLPLTMTTRVLCFGGHTTLVKRLSDGKVWETVTEAASDAGCGVSLMSKHLNGHDKPHIYNEVYKIVGVGTTG